MNQNRLLLNYIQTVPLRMHHKGKEITDIVGKTTKGKPYGTNSERKVLLHERIRMLQQIIVFTWTGNKTR